LVGALTASLMAGVVWRIEPRRLQPQRTRGRVPICVGVLVLTPIQCKILQKAITST
jgi:hypothetical protein